MVDSFCEDKRNSLGVAAALDLQEMARWILVELGTAATITKCGI